MPETDNKRNFFRVNDSIALATKPLEAEMTGDINALYEERRRDFGIVNEFLLARERYLPKLIRIRRREPEIAEYITYLEDKIQMLAATLGRDKPLQKPQPTHHVNLSASGIRFKSEQALEKGTKIELTITLFPSGAPILVFGDVIRASRGHDGAWSYVVHFSHIHDDDMEQLIRHVHARQLDELRVKAV